MRPLGRSPRERAGSRPARRPRSRIPLRAARTACRRGWGACPAGRELLDRQWRRPSSASFRLELVWPDLVEALPELLGLNTGLRGELLLVDARQPSVEHDPLAGDHHVADVAGGEAEDPVPRGAACI